MPQMLIYVSKLCPIVWATNRGVCVTDFGPHNKGCCIVFPHTHTHTKKSLSHAPEKKGCTYFEHSYLDGMRTRLAKLLCYNTQIYTYYMHSSSFVRCVRRGRKQSISVIVIAIILTITIIINLTHAHNDICDGACVRGAPQRITRCSFRTHSERNTPDKSGDKRPIDIKWMGGARVV